jgi:hypothetical protein
VKKTRVEKRATKEWTGKRQKKQALQKKRGPEHKREMSGKKQKAKTKKKRVP